MKTTNRITSRSVRRELRAMADQQREINAKGNNRVTAYAFGFALVAIAIVSALSLLGVIK